MNTYIVILRGINVSGQKKVPMAELRQVLQDNGLNEVHTYIQSGNLVLKSDLEKASIAALIMRGIQKHFAFEVPVQVLTSKELSDIIGDNPFENQDLSKLHVTFLADIPSQKTVGSLPASPNPREAYFVKDRCAYVYCPDGYGRTKLNNNFFEKHLEVSATTRNWKTCSKLLDMAQTLR